MSSTTVRAALSAISVAVLAVALLGVATPAHAAARDGICNIGEFCYYYNSNQAGSVSDHAGSLASYGNTQPTCYEFKGAGNGQGRCIKNDAASAWNRTGKTVRVFYNSNYGGTFQSFAPADKKNLTAALKNNASHRVIPRDPVSSGEAFALARILGSNGSPATGSDRPHTTAVTDTNRPTHLTNSEATGEMGVYGVDGPYDSRLSCVLAGTGLVLAGVIPSFQCVKIPLVPMWWLVW